MSGSIESFNGRMRDELFKETLFFTPNDPGGWPTGPADYDIRRPYSSLRYRIPEAYATNLSATDDRLRNPDKFRRSSLLYPRHYAYQPGGSNDVK